MPDAAIREALRAAGKTSAIARAAPLGGGCIHDVRLLALDDGTNIVAKIGSGADAQLFAEEANGLRALAATQTVRVPAVVGEAQPDGACVLLLEFLQRGRATPAMWDAFGVELARLHESDAGDRYGFAIDNHCGPTPQPNGWMDDWIEFNRVHRIGHQFRLAHDGGHLSAGDAQRIDRLIDALDALLPGRPHPALLHGDLWSGNAVPLAEGRIAVIDPAPSIGDGWADLAMMRLFGGFDARCFESYRAHRSEPIDHADLERRIAVYQLYHVLNHVNLFGSGYRAQAMSLVSTLSF